MANPSSVAFGKAACGVFAAAFFASHDGEDMWWSEDQLAAEGVDPCVLCNYLRSARKMLVVLTAGSFESIAAHAIETRDVQVGFCAHYRVFSTKM